MKDPTICASFGIFQSLGVDKWGYEVQAYRALYILFKRSHGSQFLDG